MATGYNVVFFKASRPGYLFEEVSVIYLPALHILDRHL
jgi:hypothetical protein